MPNLEEQLAAAHARIAELEAAQAGTHPALPQPASFVLESIKDAFVAVDGEFRYVWVNSEAERFCGLRREDMLGRTSWELFPAASGTELEQQLRLVLADKQPREFDNYYAPSARWYFNKAFSTVDGGLAIYWRDVTEQKRLQAELHRQASVLAQVHDSIITTDLEGNITHWNRGAEQLFGYASEEVLGRHVSLLYFEEDRSQVDADILGPLLRDGWCEREPRNRRKSGEECFIRLSLSLLRDEAQRPYAMLGVSTDVTAQRKAEKLLRESEELYRGLVEAMPQIAYTTDAAGRTTLVNRFWREYAGVTAAEGLELDWLVWVHPEDVQEHFVRWTECLRQGIPFEREYRLRNSAGEYRWHLSRVVPVRGTDGRIIHWVGTSTDIDARKSIEAALQQSEERFRLASLALEGFVYDWNPLTGTVYRSGDWAKLLGVSAAEAEQTEAWWQ